jgi:hypothetical protein
MVRLGGADNGTQSRVLVLVEKMNLSGHEVQIVRRTTPSMVGVIMVGVWGAAAAVLVPPSRRRRHGGKTERMIPSRTITRRPLLEMLRLHTIELFERIVPLRQLLLLLHHRLLRRLLRLFPFVIDELALELIQAQ